MKPTLYIETSVISYLASRTSRDLIVAAHQEITREWWEEHRSEFDLCSSEVVIEEASLGDEQTARKRISYLENIALLEVNKEATQLAQLFIEQGPLPSTAVNDALHIAITTVHQKELLLTWNCKHIANPIMQKSLEKICTKNGYEKPTMCTPQDLLGKYL